jgi:hypothetical protein
MKPDPAAVAAFEAAFPVDPRARRGQMFGHPCGFVNGNMFFGTFGATLIARVGETAASTATSPMKVFVPREGRAWKEYVVVDASAVSEPILGALARKALDHTAGLPPKEKKPAKAKVPAKKRGEA